MAGHPSQTHNELSLGGARRDFWLVFTCEFCAVASARTSVERSRLVTERFKVCPSNGTHTAAPVTSSLRNVLGCLLFVFGIKAKLFSNLWTNVITYYKFP